MTARRTDIGVGVVGYGYWGPNLVRNLHQTRGLVLRAVSDSDPARLATATRVYPTARGYPSSDALLADRSVEAVVIATPVKTHFTLAREALEAGKDVLLTKPATLRSADARRLVDLARKGRRILMMDHTFVYSGAVRRLRQFLDDGTLGKPYYFDAVRVNLGAFQSDVNVLWDLAPHDLSILDYLIGEDPISLSAIGAAPIVTAKWRRESIAHLTLRYRRGFFAHIHVNWLSPIKIRRTLIGGSRKMIVYDHLDVDNQLRIYDKGIEIHPREAIRRAEVSYRFGDMIAPKVDTTEALELECRHFAECLRIRGRPLTDGESGYRVVRLLELADESMRQGGRTVPVRFELASRGKR